MGSGDKKREKERKRMLSVREYIAVIFFFSYTFVCYPILYSPITTHIFLSLPPPRIVRSCVFSPSYENIIQ